MAMILLGTVAMACFTISLFFIRFWKTTRDRFFLFFAFSFAMEGLERIMIGIMHPTDEQEPVFYLLRLLSFGMILYAIIDKNRSLRPPTGK